MVDSARFPLLCTIDSPSDLRRIPESGLIPLAQELRQFIIESIGETGGHLSSNLGTIELTVALHYVYETPNDRIVWDVGHQSYAHKILTGRRDRMPTLRQKHGLAGFPKRDESEYDTFGVGHSSTSISAALGMAVAAKLQESDRRVAAIIGDGAMTAGMAFEAMNHAGDMDTDILVILNDNDMSISPNVGGLSNYLARALSGKLYSQVKEGSKKVLKGMPTMWELARRAEEHVKGMVVPGTLFEELGFNYIGPIDGHDLPTLVTTLRNLRSLKGPQFLHVVTTKGKGYAPAELNPCEYHGVSAFNTTTGQFKKPSATGPTYTQIFGQWLCDMAALDPRLVGITPAMREGSGLVEFEQKFKNRYFDVGIAEQHAVTLAAGLACDGIKPVVAIYSTFLQRGYDQLIHDVAIQNLPVLFAIDRAGLVGADGPTHAGAFDVSFLRCIPNMVLMAPSDENECRQMLYTAFNHEGPTAVRYPRGQGPGVAIVEKMSALPMGKAEVRRRGNGSGVTVLAFGSAVPAALAAGDQLDATVVNMRFIKPLDEELVIELASRSRVIVTVEDNVVAGGAGSAVNEVLANMRDGPIIVNLGLPDRFVEHGNREDLLADCGLDAKGIVRAAQVALANLATKALPLGINSK